MNPIRKVIWGCSECSDDLDLEEEEEICCNEAESDEDDDLLTEN